MLAKNQAATVTYTALNTSTNVGQTGDAANHTLKTVVDGTEVSVAATPVQVDSTNLPGCYKVALLAANLNGNDIYFGGVSSTSGVVIVPRTFTTDGGVLPVSAAPGASGGLPTVDAANGVKLSAGTDTGQVTTNSGGVNINYSQTGLTPRALDSVADAAITVGDCLVASACTAAGKEDVIGTAYRVKTPSTGTVIRSFTLDSGTAPTSRS